MELMDEELKLEQELRQEARELTMKRIKREVDRNRAANTAIGKKIISYGFDKFFSGVNTFVERELKPRRGVQAAYRPMIQTIAKEVYPDKLEDTVSLLCLATLSICINSVLSNHKALLNAVSNMIGKAIEEEAQATWFLAQKDLTKKASILNGMKVRVSTYHKAYYFFNIVRRHRDEVDKSNMPHFSHEAKVKLGGKLIEMLIQATGLFECFSPRTAYNKKEIDQLIPSQRLVEMWNKNEEHLLNNVFRSGPMIVRPKAWTSYYDGGYYGELSAYHRLLRIKDLPSVFHDTYMAKLDEADLSNVMAAVNAIQSTPWKINQRVLDVVYTIFEKGIHVGGIPDLKPIPQLPRLAPPYTHDELKAHKQLMVLTMKKEARRRSLCLRAYAEFNTAKRYSKYERIYFPCNMDFRGRIYPIPVFSFQGDDLSKGLILMQDVPPSTGEDKAEYWFRITGCNLFGNDKISFEEQLKWIEDHESIILSIAKEPLGDNMGFWTECDSPFQFLAWCFAYEEMLEYKRQNNGTKGWRCGIPIAFDGTCSGLQHYSAALRDELGGAAVNLRPAEKPQDIYALVADKVNEYLKADAEHGDGDEYRPSKREDGATYLHYGTKSLARQWLAYGVDRKVTKRCVMTLVYGSKQYGFKEHIISDTINPAISDGKGDMFTATRQALGNYLAKLIWKGVSQVVVKAVDGMKWLQEIAGTVANTGVPVTWTTPMGLPVQQTYLELKMRVFKMRFLSTEKRWYTPETTGNISARKQAQGIAPNFVHSLDAAHLQWTVNECVKQGIHHFSMIHDSYATSPALADKLYHIVRQTFVEMYEQNDVLANFRADVLSSLIGIHDLPEPPEKGNLDIRQVLDSPYVFH